MHVYDLFSGLGGFSQAFVNRGHNVTRYDNDEKFNSVPGTIIKDVFELTNKDLEGADIVLASPPCYCFSIAGIKHHWNKDGTPKEDTQYFIELVKHTVRIIKEANPQFWVLENPRGRLRWILGKPAMTTYWAAWGTPYLKPTHLWGKLPPINWRVPMSWTARPHSRYRPYRIPRENQNCLDNLSTAKRALIPYEFSLAVCLACEGKSPQLTLEEIVEGAG